MRILNTAVKMALVSLISSLFARLLDLDFYLTAGLLALLSIHLTRKDSLDVTLKRLIDALLAISLASFMFLLFGYHFLVYSIFVLIFAYLSWVLKMPEGIVPALVLVTHLLNAGEFSLSVLVNTLALMFVALIVALPFNVFYPTVGIKKAQNYVNVIDGLLKDHLFMFSLLLKDIIEPVEYQKHHELLEVRITDVLKEARLVDKDILFLNDHRYLSYLEVRNMQFKHVNNMVRHALKIKENHPVAKEISEFIKEISYDVGLFNMAKPNLDKLEFLRQKYKLSTLPETRIEFETRAMLYQILNEIEYMLQEKMTFHLNYPDFDKLHLLK
jgi:uncharacterized membrane protein YgaE (UPF0421/DUF939 family)